MRQNKKQTDKVAVALVLCFCVVAIASVFTVRSGIDRLNNISRPDINISDNVREREAEVVRPVPIIDSQDNNVNMAPQAPPAVPPEQARAVPQYIVPVNGPVILEFSPDVPIYSVTLNQFMVHEGIDIAAPLDTPVKAIAAGTVIDVYNNDRHGITIVINHGGGLHSIYSNLSTATLVSIGDIVEQGHVIGGVGDTALFKVLSEPVLHFAMKQDGEFVNPTNFIQL